MPGLWRLWHNMKGSERGSPGVLGRKESKSKIRSSELDLYGAYLALLLMPILQIIILKFKFRLFSGKSANCHFPLVPLSPRLSPRVTECLETVAQHEGL
jgi:hypothetical protein